MEMGGSRWGEEAGSVPLGTPVGGWERGEVVEQGVTEVAEKGLLEELELEI